MILKKADGDDYTSLDGGTFMIYRQDMSSITKESVGSGWNGTENSGAGIYFCGSLPFGIYYVKEVTAPDGYTGNKDKWFCFIVAKDGIWASKAGYSKSGASEEENRESALEDAKAVREASKQDG